MVKAQGMKRRFIILGLWLSCLYADAISFRLVTAVDRVQDLVSVKNYGATGNGYADDTHALQSAFNAAVDVFIPSGTYRLTKPLVLPSSFKVIGAGAESTVLLFEEMGGYAGNSGLVVSGDSIVENPAGYMSDLTIAIKGMNGRSAIQTPRGTGSRTLLATYVFERLKFRGDQESGKGLYDYGWQRYFDIGDGCNHTFRDILIFGNYNIEDNPVATEADASSAFYFSGEQGNGGVQAPIIDHCFTHYVGISVQFGYRVSSPIVVNSQFHLGFRGIFSPNGINSTNSSDFGVIDAQLRRLNVNSQLAGVSFEKTDRVHVENVRVTRAAGGYDHGAGWYGFRFNEVCGLNIANARSYNVSTGYADLHTGMSLAGCRNAHVSGYNARKNLDYGMVLNDVSDISIFGTTFYSPEIASFYFEGGAVERVMISGDAHASLSPRCLFEAGVASSNVLLRSMSSPD